MSLCKRDFLKAGAAAVGTTILPFGPSFSAQEPDAWTAFRANVRDFLEASLRRNFTSSWDGHKSIRMLVLPPASELEIVAVEEQTREPLPKALRHFYANCSAGVDIRWLMPGRLKTAPEGYTTVDFDERTLPPPPFRRMTQPMGKASSRLEPTILGGHMSFSLRETAAKLTDNRASVSGFREAAADDPEAALHYTRYAEWWERGFPLGLDGGGNMIAIDRQDEAGRMMWLAHDSADDPGWFLEHDLLGFMLVQSRLGFPGFGGIELGNFSDPDSPPGERERRYLEERPGDVEAGLAPPSTYRINDESDEAKLWRDWLGLKQG